LAVASRKSSDVPFAVWSGENYINAKNVGISTTISYTDVELILQSFISTTSLEGTKLSIYLPNKQPEVLVVFVESELRSDQLSLFSQYFTNLMNLMETSSSSLFMPFVDLCVSLDSTIANIAYSTKHNSGKVIYFGKGTILLRDIKNRVSSTIISSINDMENVLKNQNEIFSNGVTDLIIVHLDSRTISLEEKFSFSDSTISRVQSIVSSNTKEFIGVYTSLAYDDPELNLDFVRVHSKRFIQAPTAQNVSINGTTSNSTNGTTAPQTFKKFFGGWFWELFLVCLVLIPLLIVGVYAINAIQTPLYESKKDKNKRQH